MAGGTPKREVFLRPLVPNRPSLSPGRPALVPIKPVVVPSRPVVASLAQIVQQADSAPLETLSKEFTDLPKVA